MTKKYAYGMPLYRQKEMFTELGAEVPRQTMARWVIAHAEACRPVYNILCDRLLESSYVSCDETHTQVLKENGKTAESKSWMWVRSTPYGKNKIVLFDYDPHRSADVAKRLLSDLKGYLQVDGYASYNILEKQEGLIRIGCNMHGRRYFEKARVEGAKNGKSLAEIGLKFYQKLYALEEEFRELSPEDRNHKRQEQHRPIWDEFKAWAEESQRKITPQSKIGGAFRYFLSEYDYLIGYLKVLFYLGLRVSEVVEILLSDFVLRQDGVILNVKGKGSKIRQAPVSDELWREMQIYAEEWNLRSSDFLFFDEKNKGKRISTVSIWKAVKSSAKKAKVDPLPSPHWFRHTSATLSLERGAPIHVVQARLGHASLSTTSRYLHAKASEGLSKYLPNLEGED